jgi:flagellar P-ring protein precursor FlgI
MLEQFGVDVPAGQIKVENIAAVLVTTEVPPFCPCRDAARRDRRIRRRCPEPAGRHPDANCRWRGPDGQNPGHRTGAALAWRVRRRQRRQQRSGQSPHGGRVPAGALVHVEMAVSLPPTDTVLLSLNDPGFSARLNTLPNRSTAS